MLHRISNCHNSVTHRLPPETLATVASHLEVKSLMAASRVCYFWRSTLLSSPRLWSYLDFRKSRRTLVFLARSKSAPVSVDLSRNEELSGAIKEALEGVTDRLISLRGKLDLPLNEYLHQPLPMLRWLNVYEYRNLPGKRLVPSLPSLSSLTTSGFAFPLFHVPHLVDFSCTVQYPSFVSYESGVVLLEFFRSCPLLQVISLNYKTNCKEDIKFTTEEAVYLPHLRSFTHTTYGDRIYADFLNSLSIPPTCEVTFSIKISMNSFVGKKPWTHLFPNLRILSYLTDVKKVTVASDGNGIRTAKFQNAENSRISLTAVLDSYRHINSGIWDLLDFLESSGIMHSFDTLEFRHLPLPGLRGTTPSDILYRLGQSRSLKTFVFWQCDPLDYLKNPSPSKVWCPSVENVMIWTTSLKVYIPVWLRGVAMSRQKHGVPLKRVALFLGNPEILLQCRGEMETLRGYVESVEVTHWWGD